eukprot:CAMPEP_0172648200 /NCGR_PEP_ID=MMETSP1068-20121228/241148_1 /TAXON_ID=35684 /ORGANISM="Pseudopedinella elastica, Strain CCMP716" /LENGTH=125 /DNA_ID=CAMNT_0013462509 /DNA_START=788 /DNA_END=1165 /DNA_ORIENTATION=+
MNLELSTLGPLRRLQCHAQVAILVELFLDPIVESSVAHHRYLNRPHDALRGIHREYVDFPASLLDGFGSGELGKGDVDEADRTGGRKLQPRPDEAEHLVVPRALRFSEPNMGIEPLRSFFRGKVE